MNIKKSIFLSAAIICLSACTASNNLLQKELSYTENTRSHVPIPPSELGLPTVKADPYFKVSDTAIALESPVFDRAGNLFFVSIYEGKIFKLDKNNNLSIFYEENGFMPAGIAINKEGDFLVANVGDLKNGTVTLISKEGKRIKDILSADKGLVPDDLVLDRRGGAYLSDFKGSSVDFDGGVYYLSSHGEVTPILTKMAKPNGVALSPDGKVLWATEFGNNRLHRIELNDQGGVARFGTSIPYHFVGKAPDSMRTDADGNVYVAMYGQGRVMIFNKEGLPIGQILLPGRDESKFLKVTSMVIHPDSRDMYIVSRDEIKKTGSWIFKTKALAQGTRMQSHQ